MLTKRPNSPYWQVEFTLRGRTVRRSSGTTDKKRAEALEQKLRTEIWDGDRGVTSRTWEEGVEEWKAQKARKRSLDRDLMVFARAATVFGGRPLDDIPSEEITRYGNSVAAQTSASNANRHLGSLIAFFHLMIESGFRHEPVKVKLLKGEKFEPVYLTREKYESLLKVLPPYLLPIVQFAAETGLRYSNVVGMRWEAPGPHLDLVNALAHVPPIAAKAGKSITVPLSTIAMNIVRDMERSKTGYVFVDLYGRAPIGTVKHAWKLATTKAGLGGLRFHDLRHAWATWHASAGTPSLVLQKLGGWSSERMVRHYADLSVADLRQYVK